MRLKRLFLHGFKSFADRTELTFHDGITAVVGPNGCGKSNISDAIRWVLGEQRASAIRGAKMEEAIFQGTAERRPVNRAEVALAFSNTEQRISVPYEEIEIRRTIFREGGSEYQLNRASCRLKDIVDLCRDTGLGAMAYAVIEQRMVDGILSDRTDDRRQIFEEAAGIGRYKDRRKASERRLDAAEADLARLEDLIGEVDGKVRSLARQSKRAQRYQELRERRLALEVTLAAAELTALEGELERLTARLTTLTQDEPSVRAAMGGAEAELERRRLEAGEVARARGVVAARLEEVSRRIAERDRELAVAGERFSHAERRLAQIGAERGELVARGEMLEREIASLEGERAAAAERLETLAEQLSEIQGQQQRLRQQVAEARQLDEEARRKEKEFGRRAGELETAATRAEARSAEGMARLERLLTERQEIEGELGRLGEQGDLFAEASRTLAASRDERVAEQEALAERLAALRGAEGEARRALQEVESRASLLAAQVAALDALERDFHGFAPRVAAALAAREQLPGVLAPLAEFLHLPPARAAEVEHTLGSLLQILVVDGAAAVEQVRAWLATESPGEGALALLPKEALPRLEMLLESLSFAGEAPAEAALLGRRERLATLRAEAEGAEAEREACSQGRASLADQIAEVEAERHEQGLLLQSVERELSRAEAEGASWANQRARLERSLEELERQHEMLLEAVEAAREEGAAARTGRTRLEEELAEHQERWQGVHDTLGRLEATWETARDEEAELRVVHARAEAALAETERRRGSARSGLEHTRFRRTALDREEEEHRQALAQLQSVKSDAGSQLEALFGERDALTGELRSRDEQLEAANEAAAELETRLRSLRRSGEEQAEERHRLELRRAEIEGARRSARERLEVEWGRPFEQLAATVAVVEGETHTLKAELQMLASDIERLGPINMLAIEEHEEESTRLAFLTSQRDDLVRARDDLQAAIRQINRQARDLFMETFEQVRVNYRRTFESLFEGGQCDLSLANPDDPLESDIEVSASPRGKRTQRIHLLSGGERALTALSLLFAIYLVKPSPFCVLDEVDAPLDEANVGRFVSMLQEFKKETQFIVITHNPRTMEAADWIYGVTMEEPGVSTLVGVQLDEALLAGR